MVTRDLIPSTYVPRVVDAELDELLDSLAAVVIEGAKAVGKAVTAATRASSVWELDELQQRTIAEADLDRVLESKPPILVDEWQKVEPIWDRVRRAVDAGASPGSFLLTGSASRDAASGSHSGGGRIVSVRMRPLSLAERWPGEATVSLSELLSGAVPVADGATGRRLEDYVREITRSGLPGLRAVSGRALRAQLDGYLQRVVDRDFPELGQTVRNPVALQRWMRAYAAATATTTPFERIRDAASAGSERPPARTTVQRYRNILERLFIIDDVPGWLPARNILARLAVAPKHHLADPAFAARLLGVSEAALLSGEQPGPVMPRDGTLLGALFESLVTQSLKVYAQASEASVRHLRTRGGEHEVDLIVERGDGRILALEVKLAAVIHAGDGRHLNWLKETIGEDLLDRAIVSTGEYAYRRADGIAVIPAALLGP